MAAWTAAFLFEVAHQCCREDFGALTHHPMRCGAIVSNAIVLSRGVPSTQRLIQGPGEA
jgi:hypothetical protein